VAWVRSADHWLVARFVLRAGRQLFPPRNLLPDHADIRCNATRKENSTVPMKSMEDLFVHGLQDIYMAEKRILQNLPKMAKKVQTSELKQALERHQNETQQQVQRLEEVFKMIGQKPKGVECKAIDGIIGEAQDMMQEIEDEDVRDAAILADAQAVEHYEITRYGTLTAWAKQLGHDDAAELLHQTLEEEKRTDEMLTKMAKQKVNKAAA